MKLLNNISRRQKFTVQILAYYIIFSVILAPIPQIYDSSLDVKNSFLNDDDKKSRFDEDYKTDISFDSIISKDIRPEEIGYPYTGITQDSSMGAILNAEDNLAVNHLFDLNLTENNGEITNSYSIDPISDYSDDNLQYNITGITSIKDYYPVEPTASAGQFENLHYYNYIAWAQEFTVDWDYAKFFGAKILVNYFNQFNPGLYELELVLVSANTSTPFAPNSSDVISTELGGPYDSINLMPGSTVNNINYYDFTDVVLEKGSYYIIANLTVIDYSDSGSLDYFIWAKNVTAPYDGKTFSMDTTRTWSQQYNRDLTLIPELLPSDASGQALTYTDPQAVDLKDGGSSITSLTQLITGAGEHVLTSNTSVEIAFNNSYEFVKTYSASSFVQAINGSYWSYSIDWDINWTTPLLDISPYSNLDRYQIVYTPTDWHNSAFTFYFDSVEALSGSRVALGYRLDLGDNNTASNWLLEAKSPNYLSDLVLMDDTTPSERYLLGYWLGTATQSFGYVGSNIVANTLVQEDGAGSPDNVTTGTLNFTIYDGNGNIIANKGTLTGNEVYDDTTEYSMTGITQVSDGFYTPEIYFDPSYYGTDEPGFWTAAVFWLNGTEVGFYSQRIVVQTQTQFDFVWEEQPSNNNWITSGISRKGLDSIAITGYYFNVSEPYTTGTRNVIPSATVSYNIYDGGPVKNGDLNYEGSAQYNTSILVDFSVGSYTVELSGTGAFLETNSTSFSLTVFYELALNPEYTSTNTHYTDNVVFYFALYDVTADSNLSSYDDIIVTLNDGSPIAMEKDTDYTFTYTGVPNEWALDISTTTKSLDIGIYDVYIEVFINDYRANYSTAYVSDVYSFEIIESQTDVNVITAPITIQVYHDAVFEFYFEDVTHSINLTGAAVSPSTNVSNVDLVHSTVGSLNIITVTNNNPTVSGIRIYVDVILANYESQINYVIGDLEVVIIHTELLEEEKPASSYVGYETRVVVDFNDIDNGEPILYAELMDYYLNSSDDEFVSFVNGTSAGLYNLTVINNDVAVSGIQITIILGRAGYENATAIIEIPVISIATDADFDTGYSSDIDIYYNQGFTVGILYWDINLMEYIAQPTTVDVFGNLSVTFAVSNSSDTILVNIDPISTLGYFYFDITVIEPAYAPQTIRIYVSVNERTTYLDAVSGTEDTKYANDADIVFLFEYQDGIDGNSSILATNVTADFAAANSSLDINDYFNSIIFSTVGVDYIQASFNPNTALAVGTTCIIEITFEEYGYVTKTVVIQITFYPPVDYDIAIEIEGELRQLATFSFLVSIENTTQELLSVQGEQPIHMMPDPDGDTIIVYYTFYYKDGSWETYNVSITLSDGPVFAGQSVEIEIPWQVVAISYHAEYLPGDQNQDVLVSKSTLESAEIATESAAFLDLLTFLFREYTYYMVGGLLGLAVIFIILTIYFAVIRPKKQKKKASKRRYLDKISKILTSVLAMRKVIIVHQETGLPVYEWDLGGEITVDSSLVTGFLQAVAGMGSEISGGQAGTVRKLDYGQFVVSSAAKDCICAYLFSTSDVSVDVETGLANFVDWFEKRFQTILHDWNGITDEFQKNAHQIMDTLSEELFVWTLHPLSINPMKEKEVVKLSPLSQRIYKFIKDYKEVTISVALEYFNKTPIEETLSTLFNLIDDQFLMRMRLR